MSDSREAPEGSAGEARAAERERAGVGPRELTRKANAFLCDRCGAEMFRLHAVWRCPRCGFKTDCCGW